MNADAQITVKKRLITTKEFCHKISMGKTKFHHKRNQGLIGPQPHSWPGDGKLLWDNAEIDAWIDFGQPTEERWQPIWQQILEAKWPRKNEEKTEKN